MPLLLSIETSSTVCSVALHRDEQLLGASELQIEKSHSSHITVMINQLVENCGATLEQIDAIAVSGGPGSYTGLRIGSATAKGICYALDKPLISVSTLHSLALQVINSTPNAVQYLFCPMLDARRMEVYTCLLDYQLNEVLPIEPIVLDADTFAAELQNKPIIFLGSGAGKLKQFHADNPKALFIDNIVPSAKPIGELALQKYKEQVFEDVAYYEPFYLKDVYITSSKPKA
ncbi:tRNA (adenosine(37)-N6)-threonylcarbamoyltransferase complex dimerization subunit type 1 TsaB [Pontibacter sp. KCTC 32443]|uniref:tRNA (adenosine(37)-N6)-threonylcarbamoyltransferase complex dimerization subunit type 1 TsaB n=1 Tax=Pontibacter TaxID=323449 RepID=UPI00164EAA5C|nr:MULTISPECIES: tRNA (adenosine(37)-N6)-threonylcarbamoyltransferase complex dimerization subunit type 1 TsaB [Pontibacter]MBC5775874.1 tRNA (adenosine(37)-N6)-threonylcarbamoyltransferase complex dimerization subunit type 1 TsaB [Pontibacter sp. KCTC 32443]